MELVKCWYYVFLEHLVEFSNKSIHEREKNCSSMRKNNLWERESTKLKYIQKIP